MADPPPPVVKVSVRQTSKDCWSLRFRFTAGALRAEVEVEKAHRFTREKWEELAEGRSQVMGLYGGEPSFNGTGYVHTLENGNYEFVAAADTAPGAVPIRVEIPPACLRAPLLEALAKVAGKNLPFGQEAHAGSPPAPGGLVASGGGAGAEESV